MNSSSSSSNSNSNNGFSGFNEMNPVLGFNSPALTGSGKNLARPRLMKVRKQTDSYKSNSNNGDYRIDSRVIGVDQGLGFSQFRGSESAFGNLDVGNFVSVGNSFGSNVIVDDMSKLKIDDDKRYDNVMKKKGAFGVDSLMVDELPKEISKMTIEGESNVGSVKNDNLQGFGKSDKNTAVEIENEMKNMNLKDHKDATLFGSASFTSSSDRMAEFAFTSKLDDIGAPFAEFKTPDMKGNMFSGFNRFEARKESVKDTRLKKKRGKLKTPVVGPSRVREGFGFSRRSLSGNSVNFEAYSPMDISPCDEKLANNGVDKANDTEVNTENELNKNGGIKSYASIANSNKDDVLNKLKYVPTVLNELGNEVVVFDEALISIGCMKWQKTLCGYFVGYKMSLYEMRYNIRRMWNKYRLKDVVESSNNCWLFKFDNEEHIQEIVEKGPWMINGKPLIVNKWNPDIGFVKKDHDKLPVWVKLLNVPIEAWSVEGLSAIASSVGIPIIMDAMSAHVCKFGNGRIEYARIMVEISANKSFKEEIELQYRDQNQCVKGTKMVKVEYDWKPDRCTHCNVFGHDYIKCDKRSRTEEEISALKKQEESKIEKRMEDDNLGWQRRFKGKYVPERKVNETRLDEYKNGYRMRYKWHPKNNQDTRLGQGNEGFKGKETKESYDKEFPSLSANEEGKGRKNVQDNKMSGNRYDALKKVENEDGEIGSKVNDRRLADGFVKQGIQPSREEMQEWSNELIEYFRGAWESMKKASEQNQDKIDGIVEDVLEVESLGAQFVASNVVLGSNFFL